MNRTPRTQRQKIKNDTGKIIEIGSRTVRINIQLTEHEEKLLKLKAVEEGLSLGSFMKKISLAYSQ